MPFPPMPGWQVPTLKAIVSRGAGICPNFTDFGKTTLSWDGVGSWRGAIGDLSLTVYWGPPWTLVADWKGNIWTPFDGGGCPRTISASGLSSTRTCVRSRLTACWWAWVSIVPRAPWNRRRARAAADAVAPVAGVATAGRVAVVSAKFRGPAAEWPSARVAAASGPAAAWRSLAPNRPTSRGIAAPGLSATARAKSCTR